MSEKTESANSTKAAARTAHAFLLKTQGLMAPEEVHALSVLIAAADQQEDWSPKTWHCDSYCRNVRHISCEGMLSAENAAEAQCPYLDEMLY